MNFVREASKHFKEMLQERNISEKWVERTLKSPDILENMDDGTTHYMKMIEEYGDRWLRIIVNENRTPAKIITAFFDRRLRRKYHEDKS